MCFELEYVVGDKVCDCHLRLQFEFAVVLNL